MTISHVDFIYENVIKVNGTLKSVINNHLPGRYSPWRKLPSRHHKYCVRSSETSWDSVKTFDKIKLHGGNIIFIFPFPLFLLKPFSIFRNRFSFLSRMSKVMHGILKKKKTSEKAIMQHLFRPFESYSPHTLSKRLI